jgi:hypothetical protein
MRSSTPRGEASISCPVIVSWFGTAKGTAEAAVSTASGAGGAPLRRRPDKAALLAAGAVEMVASWKLGFDLWVQGYLALYGPPDPVRVVTAASRSGVRVIRRTWAVRRMYE